MLALANQVDQKRLTEVNNPKTEYLLVIVITGKSMKHKKLVTAIASIVGLTVLSTEVVQAGDVTVVNSISDNPDPGFITLRDAIEDANAIGFRTINFDQTLFSTPQTIVLEQGELLISADTTINGPGKDFLTIDGNENSRLFRIDDDTDALINVEISGVTLTHGNGSSPADTRAGGCVLSLESLTLNDSVVTNCQSSGRGGGVFTRFGSLSLSDSTVIANRSGNEGGGLYFREAVGEIFNSTISNNSSSSEGGGIFISRDSDISISNSTISGNEGRNINERQGGGIFVNTSSSSLLLKNATILNNTDNGIFLRQPSLINISNSIIANNTNGDCDFSNINGNSSNQNNMDTDGSCDVLATNHFTVTNPRLGPLSHNGGPTMTHLPVAGSPAIDNGDDVLCTELDQRSELRPEDGDDDGSPVCDIGAVELGSLEDLIFKDGFN